MAEEDEKMSETKFGREYVANKNVPGGEGWVFSFSNGYGASVIRGAYSYGGRDGLYEVGVLHSGSLCYDTEITDDVIGHLNEDEVTALIARIESLPAAR